MIGNLFAEPRITIYPTNENANSFWLPGHDSREVVLEYPVVNGLLRGQESIEPVVFANRFGPQEVRLGPFEFEVDPTFR